MINNFNNQINNDLYNCNELNSCNNQMNND